MDIRVTGAEEFAVLSRALKEAGDKTLRRELYKGLNRAVKPLTKDVKQGAADYLPDRYAELIVLGLKIQQRRRASGNNPSIYLLAKPTPSRNLSSINRGRLRHPLFGNRKRWYDQRVRPGFWTKPLEAGAPEVREELVKAIRDVAAQIDRAV